MEDFKTVTDDELAITQADIDETLGKLESYYRNLLNPTGNLPTRKRSRSRKVRDNGKYMILRTKPDPNSPINQIREGKPIKIKTIFHAVELELKDKFGGTFICEYYIQDTIKVITDGLAKAYPPITKSELEELAKQNNKSYEETKKLIAFSFAQNIFDMRTTVAKFFHDQLEPTLKIVLQDLIIDTELIGIEKYGYKLAKASDYEKVQKYYSQMRKQRMTILKGKVVRRVHCHLTRASLNKP